MEKRPKQKKRLNIEIGERIQICRNMAGLTQEELAERIDCSTQFISMLECGHTGASLETIIKLSEVLNASTEWFLRGLHIKPTVTTVAEKLSLLSPAQLETVDKLTDDLLSLIRVTKDESEAAIQ